MTPSKSFWCKWKPHDAFVDFARLKADEIGVLMQIINLNYIKNGPVDNDPKFIGNACNIRPSSAAKIIASLVDKGVINIVDGNMLIQKRAGNEIKVYQKCIKSVSKVDEKCVKSRTSFEQNQHVAASRVNQSKSNKKPPTSLNVGEPGEAGDGGGLKFLKKGGMKGYDVLAHLTDKGRAAVRKAAPGWDIQHLAGIFNNNIHEGRMDAPKSADAAFPVWAGKYTKGKKP